MIKKMGYDWRLRQVMAEHEMFQTSDRGLASPIIRLWERTGWPSQAM
ncbi:hypothetical protein [Streptomyces sp. NPDC005181]